MIALGPALITLAADRALAPTLASWHVGPVQFDEPSWLWLLVPLAALTLWIARRSLAGLGTRAQRIALAVRLLVLALVVGAIARPQWRDQAEDVALTVVLDSSRSVPLPRQRAAEQYVEQARAANPSREDRLGVISVAETALAQSLPSKLNTAVERTSIGNDLATNLAAGVRLAMAVRPADAASRLLLITDGNETAGSLLDAAEAARAAGVPIDILPVRYRSQAEVTVDQLIAPTMARVGETVNLRVTLTAIAPARGRLTILLNDEPIDLDPDTAGLGTPVSLTQGVNVLTLPIKVPAARAQRYRAVFEPLPGEGGAPADTVLENNEALAVTFVSGEGRVLVLGAPEEREAYEPLLAAFGRARLQVDYASPAAAPTSLEELNAYEAIVLANTPSYDLSQQQQELLRQYVHDSGGGLVMTGGPQAFGAGGWIGSPLEDALPVRLDPPQKRQMPRGALMIISHSVEMPDGVSWGKKTAKAAVDALSRLDLAGLVEYRGGASATLVHPLSEVGDGSAIARSINSLQFGDMQDYSGAFALCIAALSRADAGAKHIILITDGDAQPPTTQQIQDLRKNRITVSTVGVFPHIAADLRKLRDLAQATGGRAYEVVDQGGLGQIVQIFIKEAQTVKRSLIWEGTPFAPSFVGAAAENLRGFTAFPPLSGYIVTGEREGLAQVTLRGKENDPIAAQWQHGLGRAFVYTSDATARWNPSWIGWPGYDAFWEQALRWTMRPSGNPNVRITTQRDGDLTRVLVDALDPAGERLNFARFIGRVAGPGGAAQDVTLQQVGPGRYEGVFDSKAAGSYLLSLRYAAPKPDGQGVMEGSVQAAVTKPFADEFRATADNLPLLEQVAAMTGGRVLEGVPERDNLWRRDGLTMPVALTPIWPVLAIAGIALFLMDVGVRRVRVDLGAIRRFFFARSARAKAGAQIGALKAAREAARQGIARRAAQTTAESPPETAAAAGVKFEASAEQLRAAASASVLTPGSPAQGAAEPPKPATKPTTPAEPPEGGLSRLKQAKKRAREDLQE